MKRIAVAIGGVAVLGVATWLWLRTEESTAPEPAAETPSTQTDVLPEIEVESAEPFPDPVPPPEGLPPEFYVKLEPGEEIALTVPRGLKSGIRCPDGTYLPPLNGVPVGGPVARNRMLGHLPQVVGKMCDLNGLEWYVHADGSRTTTKWTRAIVHGEQKMQVVTLHFGPIPDGEASPALPRDSSPPQPDGGSR